MDQDANAAAMRFSTRFKAVKPVYKVVATLTFMHAYIYYEGIFCFQKVAISVPFSEILE